MRMYLGELPAFFQHRVHVGAHDLRADRAVDDLTDRMDVLTKVDVALFRHKRRVRGYSVQDAEAVRFANLFQVCGIDEELHDPSFCVSPTTYYATLQTDLATCLHVPPSPLPTPRVSVSP